jgi:hypothetical protein
MFNWDFILENETKIGENNLNNIYHIRHNYKQWDHYDFNSLIDTIDIS